MPRRVTRRSASISSFPRRRESGDVEAFDLRDSTTIVSFTIVSFLRKREFSDFEAFRSSREHNNLVIPA